MAQTEFSRLLRQWREQQGLQQKDVARYCLSLGHPLTPSMVSHLETGRRPPASRDIVQALAQALRLTQAQTAQLLLAAGYSAAAPSTAGSLLEKLPNLLAHLTDPEFMKPFLETETFPALQGIDRSLTGFLQAWRGHAEVRQALRQRTWDRALEKAEHSHRLVKSASAGLLAYLGDAQGVAHDHLGRIAVAERLFHQSQYHALQSDDAEAVARIHVHLASLYKNTAHLAEAEQEYQTATEIFVRLGNERLVAWVERKQSTLYLFQGEWRKALKLLVHSLEVFQRYNKPYEISHAHYSLGWAYSLQGDWAAAIDHRRKGLEITEQLNQQRGWVDKYHLLRGYLFLGDDLRQIGQQSEAQELLERARALSEEIGEQYERGRIYLCLAKLYDQMGESQRPHAVELAELSRDFHLDKGHKMRLAQSLILLGRLYADLPGERDGDAEHCYEQALTLCRDPGVQNHYYEAAALVNLCDLYRQRGKYASAEEHSRTAEKICREYQYNQHLARLKCILAQVAFHQAREAEAASLGEEAYQSAYRFNGYLADEIHHRMTAFLAETLRPPHTARGGVLIRCLHRLLSEAKEASSWYWTLDRPLQQKLGQQIIAIGKMDPQPLPEVTTHAV